MTPTEMLTLLQKEIDLITFEADQRIGLRLKGVEGENIFIPLSGQQLSRLAHNLTEMVRRRPDVLTWTVPQSPK